MDSFISLPLVAIDGQYSNLTIVKNTRFFENIRALTAAEAAKFTTGQAVIETIQLTVGAQIHTLITSLTVAQVQAAANSAIPGAVTSGQVPLVAGTVAITIPGLTSANKAFPGLAVFNTGSLTVKFLMACTANTLTITALLASGSINTADISTVNYFVL